MMTKYRGEKECESCIYSLNSFPYCLHKPPCNTLCIAGNFYVSADIKGAEQTNKTRVKCAYCGYEKEVDMELVGKVVCNECHSPMIVVNPAREGGVMEYTPKFTGLPIIKGRCRIKWIYWHSLNSKSKVQRVKEGEYYGKIKHTYKHWEKDGARQMACVHFDGNKHASFVPYNDLIFPEKGRGSDDKEEVSAL
ncbi:MAG: hypothetical protein PHF74_05670 [Dehalococcoidales bacterium]|nr:hypothetical protein [Dehalococcoidales bacterium]